MRIHRFVLASVILVIGCRSSGLRSVSQAWVEELWASGPGTHPETWHVTLDSHGHFVASHSPRLADLISDPSQSASVIRGTLTAGQLRAIDATLKHEAFSSLPSGIHSGFIEMHGPMYSITALVSGRVHDVALFPGAGPLPPDDAAKFRAVWDRLRSINASIIPPLPD